MAARKEKDEQPAPRASVNLDELRELIALMRDNGLAELELEREDFRVRLRRDSGNTHEPNVVVPDRPVIPMPVIDPVLRAPDAAAPAADAKKSEETAEDLHVITSPIVGTFYRSPSPTADAFVKIGSNVEVDTVVCIIEAMKLMNEIQAETAGEVVKIYVENGQPVEYGQPLFGIRS
ncbi:MAG TPA: acetyl-CoA carboxylase biotin carboxyl carrier protein [Pyrinomonadaceae bacterium]|nr:acetyl-CoA carboxylase biotin carboxyl carrier protein [Pyrinomonadaceae bacterium]